MKRYIFPLLFFLLAACSQVAPPGSPTLDLSPLAFGTAGDEGVTGLAKHSSGLYSVGYTNGNLHGAPKGSYDAFIRKSSGSGAVVWGRQFGTSAYEYASDVASDGSGNAYVTGNTDGSLVASRGNTDRFLRKYTPSGGIAWTVQFGGPNYDYAQGVAVAGSNIYVAGYGSVGSDVNATLTKFNPSGKQLWSKNFGTSAVDYTYDVAADSGGNAYVVGMTQGSLVNTNGGGYDLFVRKYTPSGAVAWTQQLHYSSYDIGVAVAVSGPSVYVAGQSYFNVAASTDLDVRLIKLTSGGGVVWSNYYGSGYNQYASDLSVVGSSLFISGNEYFNNDYNGFLLRYNANGTYVWRADQTSPNSDTTEAVLARSASEIYASGATNGTLGGSNSGGYDAYLRRLNGSGSTVWTDQ